MDELCFNEGTAVAEPAYHPLLRPLVVAWRYSLLMMEIEGLPPALLSDIGVLNGDVRGFAWAVANDRTPIRQARGPEPVVTIGSDVWARAFLLHMR